MKLLFNCWTEVQRNLRPLKNVLWLFDYDGTLTPIVSHPDRAVLKPMMRSLLKKLTDRFPLRVGVLSGRSMNDLRRQVDVPGLIYGAAHGFEWQGPRVAFKRTSSPDQVKRLSALEHDLRFDFRNVNGAWVEAKKWMLALHYRQVQPADQPRIKAVLESVRAVVKWKGFKIQEGAKVMEVFSDLKWNKGEAVRWLKRKLRAARVFYIGDDSTDETVFSALGPRDVSVHVGAPGASLARYHVARQQDVISVLRRVYRL